MAEQIRDKYSRLKKVLLTTSTDQLMSGGQMMGHPSTLPLTQVLLELTDQNKFLLFEVEELKAKLSDSESDLKMLREQLRNMRNIQRFQDRDPDGNTTMAGTIRSESSLSTNRGLVEEAVVEQLESFRSKVLLMERDLQMILEEKEELIVTRDNYKRKVQRLTQQLNQLIQATKNDHRSTGQQESTNHEIDSVITENLFLKEKLKALEEEKRLNVSTMNKYKVLLEKSSKGSILNSLTQTINPIVQRQQYKISEQEAPVTAIVDTLSPTVISSKQIESFITSHELNSLPINEHSLNRLRSLLLALFEAFCDKSSALIIHKKNNKLLGKRIHELEDKIRELISKEKVMMLTYSRDLRLDQEIERHTRELDSRIGMNLARDEIDTPSRLEFEGTSFDDESRVPSSLTTSTQATAKYGNPDHDQDLEDIDRVIQSLRAEVERVGMVDEETDWTGTRDNLNRESSIDASDVDVSRMDIGSEMRATREVIAKEVSSLSGTSRTSSSSSSECSELESDPRVILNPDPRRRIVSIRRQTERIDDDDDELLMMTNDYN